MRKLLLLAVLAVGIAAAQCPTGFVSVTGALVNADGSPYSGLLWIAPTSSIRRTAVSAQARRGNASISGNPLCLAPGTYTVTYRPGGVAYWTVPNSGPVTIASIESASPTPISGAFTWSSITNAKWQALTNAQWGALGN